MLIPLHIHFKMLRTCWLQGPEYIWVDNSAVCGNLLRNIFPSVKIVLEDTTHLMRRYMRTLTPGHPLNRESQFPKDVHTLCLL